MEGQVTGLFRSISFTILSTMRVFMPNIQPEKKSHQGIELVLTWALFKTKPDDKDQLTLIETSLAAEYMCVYIYLVLNTKYGGFSNGEGWEQNPPSCSMTFLHKLSF